MDTVSLIERSQIKEENTSIQKLLDVIASILADEYIQALRKQGEKK